MQKEKFTTKMWYKRLHKPNKARVLGWGLPLALLISVGIMGAVRGGQTNSDIAWYTDPAQAQRFARAVHRPLLLEFHTQACEWCAKMEAETFSDTRVIELSRRFVCIRIDGDMEPEVARQYSVHEHPTTVFADSAGHVLGKIPGYISANEFAALQSQTLRLDKAPGHR